jgi:hypothetical protein
LPSKSGFGLPTLTVANGIDAPTANTSKSYRDTAA